MNSLEVRLAQAEHAIANLNFRVSGLEWLVDDDKKLDYVTEAVDLLQEWLADPGSNTLIEKTHEFLERVGAESA